MHDLKKNIEVININILREFDIKNSLNTYSNQYCTLVCTNSTSEYS